MFGSSADFRATRDALVANGVAALAIVRDLKRSKGEREAALGEVRRVENQTGIRLMGAYN
jgi:hypothetical protein